MAQLFFRRIFSKVFNEVSLSRYYIYTEKRFDLLNFFYPGILYIIFDGKWNNGSGEEVKIEEIN